MLTNPVVSAKRAIFTMSLPHKQPIVFLQFRTYLPTIAFKLLRPLARQPPCSQRATHPVSALPLSKALEQCNTNTSSINTNTNINTAKVRSLVVVENLRAPKKLCKKCLVDVKICCPRLFTMAAHSRPHLHRRCLRINKLNIPATLSHILTLLSANRLTSLEPHAWTLSGRSTVNLK
jgi:hypothetical protein